MTIAKKIYELRQQHNLSQKEFAEKIGSSQSAVNYWENGKRIPKIEQLKNVSIALKVPICELIEYEDCKNMKRKE